MELLLKTLSIISLLFSLQLRARDDDCVPPGADVRGGEAIQVRAGGDLNLVMMLIVSMIVMIAMTMMRTFPWRLSSFKHFSCSLPGDDYNRGDVGS